MYKTLTICTMAFEIYQPENSDSGPIPVPSNDLLASFGHVTSVCIHWSLGIFDVCELDNNDESTDFEPILQSVKDIFPNLRNLHLMVLFYAGYGVELAVIGLGPMCTVIEEWKLEECILALDGYDVEPMEELGYIKPVKLPNSDEYVTYKDTSVLMYRCLDDVHSSGTSSRATLWIVDDKVFAEL